MLYANGLGVDPFRHLREEHVVAMLGARRARDAPGAALRRTLDAGRTYPRNLTTER